MSDSDTDFTDFSYSTDTSDSTNSTNSAENSMLNPIDHQSYEKIFEVDWLPKKLDLCLENNDFEWLFTHFTDYPSIIRSKKNTLEMLLLVIRHFLYVYQIKDVLLKFQQIFAAVLDSDTIEHDFSNNKTNKKLLLNCYETFDSLEIPRKIVEMGVYHVDYSSFREIIASKKFDLINFLLHNCEFRCRFHIWNYDFYGPRMINRDDTIVPMSHLKKILQSLDSEKIQWKITRYTNIFHPDVLMTTLDYILLRSGPKPSVEDIFMIDLFVEFSP